MRVIPILLLTTVAAGLLVAGWFLLLPKQMVITVEAADAEEVPFEARWAHTGETIATDATPYELEVHRPGWSSRSVEIVSLDGEVDVALEAAGSGRALARDREAVSLNARPGGVAVRRP